MEITRTVERAKILVVLFSLFAVTPFVLLMPKPAKAITVGPPKLEFTVDPGGVVKGKVFVENEGANTPTRTFYPVFEKFTEDNGNKQFTSEESDLSTWFKIADEVTLNPGERKFVDFKIEAPKDATPGGHFAVMWWSTAPAKSKSKSNQSVSVVTRAGILVYLTVTGDVFQSGSITSFKSDKKIYNSLPAHFAISFKNTGNVHLTPTGTIFIKNLFGKIVFELPVNQYKQQILPQSNRKFDVNWESGRAFGIYKATLSLAFGENGKDAKTVWLFVLPWKWMLLILFILFLLIFVLPRGIKKYNKWIIAQARRR